MARMNGRVEGLVDAVYRTTAVKVGGFVRQAA